MSSGRLSRNSRITDEEINDLIARLRALLPELRRKSGEKVSECRVLSETCSYIRVLQGEVDDLSNRLSELLENMDSSSSQAQIIRNLLC